MCIFIEIGSAVWAVALTHTYIHTYTHTDTLGSILTYSVRLTEYKKGNDEEVYPMHDETVLTKDSDFGWYDWRVTTM